MAGPTLEGFIAFINNQEPERPINHTEGWCECAMGDYVRTIWAIANKPFESVVADFSYDAQFREYEKLMDLLGNPSVSGAPDTYGALQKWLKDNPQ